MIDVRIDKWLWAARFFKTRSLAKAAIQSGKIKREGVNLKPSSMVKQGECLSIRRGQEHFEVHVLELSEQRGPASQAQKLYQETEQSIARRERERQARLLAPKFDEKPDKKQRRQIRSMRSQL